MKNSPDTLAKRNDLRKYWKEVIDAGTVTLYVDKICKDCEQLKPCKWTTGFTQTGKPEYRARCDECFNKHGNKIRQKNRTRVTTNALDRKYARKVRCVEYLGGECIDCGYSQCVKALTFHHRDSSTKSFDISQFLDVSWERIEAELDKCDLLCFNCHMERHCDEDQEMRTTLGEPKTLGCTTH